MFLKKCPKVSCTIFWINGGWLVQEGEEERGFTDAHLEELGYDTSRMEQVPLPMDKQWEEILNIEPTRIVLLPNFISIEYGDGFRLTHVCRSPIEGICMMADELYWKRLNPTWNKQPPSDLIGLRKE